MPSDRFDGFNLDQFGHLNGAIGSGGSWAVPDPSLPRARRGADRAIHARDGEPELAASPRRRRRSRSRSTLRRRSSEHGSAAVDDRSAWTRRTNNEASGAAAEAPCSASAVCLALEELRDLVRLDRLEEALAQQVVQIGEATRPQLGGGRVMSYAVRRARRRGRAEASRRRRDPRRARRRCPALTSCVLAICRSSWRWVWPHTTTRRWVSSRISRNRFSDVRLR